MRAGGARRTLNRHESLATTLGKSLELQLHLLSLKPILRPKEAFKRHSWFPLKGLIVIYFGYITLWSTLTRWKLIGAVSRKYQYCPEIAGISALRL